MKRFAVAVLLCMMNYALCIAQIGTWRNFLSYAEPQQIQAAGNDLFVMASGGLYQYNQNDKSIYTYDKVNGMSDVDIKHIRWCKQAKRLVVVYSNSNIDLVETNGDVTNIHLWFWHRQDQCPAGRDSRNLLTQQTRLPHIPA